MNDVNFKDSLHQLYKNMSDTELLQAEKFQKRNHNGSGQLCSSAIDSLLVIIKIKKTRNLI